MNRAEAVRETLKECLWPAEDGRKFREAEDPIAACKKAGGIVVHGVLRTFAFHPHRLRENRAVIKQLLTGLPEQFYKSSGGGWSFLNLCEDAEGILWTGEHATMEELICLGEASGFVSYCLPREMWRVLPGGMPYIVIDLDVTA